MDDWERIYHTTPCYLVSFSNEGLITRINNAFLQHLGYAADEVVHKKKLTEMLTIGSKIFFDTHFYPLIKMHGKANEIFLSFKTENGNDLPVLLNVHLEATGDIFEVHCGGMQISNRNRFEKELLEAKRTAENALLENRELIELKTQLQKHQELLEHQLSLLSRINSEHKQINKVLSHDLQEPIRKISLFSKRLVNEYSDTINPYILTYLQKIGASSDKIRDLISSMDRFLSLDQKKIHLERTDLAVIFEKGKEMSGCNNRKEVTFIQSSTLPVDGDRKLLALLFKELLENSIKFRKKGGVGLQIQVSCEYIMRNIFEKLEGKYRYARFVRITYSDNGEGFENHYADKIFNLFEKANINEAGLGLGLAHCKKIIGLHNGTISASGKVGCGATFTISLPVLNPV